jgi:hypothetical protein
MKNLRILIRKLEKLLIVKVSKSYKKKINNNNSNYKKKKSWLKPLSKLEEWKSNK